MPSKYIEFSDDTPQGKSTKVITITASISREIIGIIKWSLSSKQYAFFPEANTFWTSETLGDVGRKITELTANEF